MDKKGPVAQWLEQRTHNSLVAGSNPAGATPAPKGLSDWIQQGAGQPAEVHEDEFRRLLEPVFRDRTPRTTRIDLGPFGCIDLRVTDEPMPPGMVGYMQGIIDGKPQRLWLQASSAAPAECDSLTEETVAAAKQALSAQGPVFRWFVVTPAARQVLRQQARPNHLGNAPELGGPFTGVQVYTKNDQHAPAWAFADETLLRRYLNGELTEIDLVIHATEKRCMRMNE
jgi:hypothetical protein